jgi:hypothetical protein
MVKVLFYQHINYIHSYYLNIHNLISNQFSLDFLLTSHPENLHFTFINLKKKNKLFI